MAKKEEETYREFEARVLNKLDEFKNQVIAYADDENQNFPEDNEQVSRLAIEELKSELLQIIREKVNNG